MNAVLPSAQELDRLYWFENLNTMEIAERFHTSSQAVRQKMKRHGIPRRSSQHRRSRGCQEPGCKKVSARIKRWCRGRIRWYWSMRCAKHYHMWKRFQDARWKRRKFGITTRYRPRQIRTTKPLGRLSIIARED